MIEYFDKTDQNSRYNKLKNSCSRLWLNRYVYDNSKCTDGPSNVSRAATFGKHEHGLCCQPISPMVNQRSVILPSLSLAHNKSASPTIGVDGATPADSPASAVFDEIAHGTPFVSTSSNIHSKACAAASPTVPGCASDPNYGTQSPMLDKLKTSLKIKYSLPDAVMAPSVTRRRSTPSRQIASGFWDADVQRVMDLHRDRSQNKRLLAFVASPGSPHAHLESDRPTSPDTMEPLSKDLNFFAGMNTLNF